MSLPSDPDEEYETVEDDMGDRTGDEASCESRECDDCLESR
jgi:hypothetical protein